MQTNSRAFGIFAHIVFTTSCKKSTPAATQSKSQSTTNTNSLTTINSVSPTSATYSISFVDGTAKTYTLIPTIQLALALYPQNANIEFGAGIQTQVNNNYVYEHIYLGFSA